MPLQLVKPCLVLDELPKQERKQLFVVAGLSEVFSESLFMSLPSVKPL